MNIRHKIHNNKHKRDKNQTKTQNTGEGEKNTILCQQCILAYVRADSAATTYIK